tara:strand:+ start:4212 stop:4841 length:630 start_codon:yes stop_codon:yes gene_type:complete
MNTHNTLKLIALAGLSFSMTMLPMGCTKSDSDAAAAAHDDHDDHGDHAGHDHDHGDHAHDQDGDMANAEGELYEGILGEITLMPADDGSLMKIHHEHIPTFKSMDGTIKVNARGVAGMASMTMPFPLGDGVNIDAFKVGDKVKFDLLVTWSTDTPKPYHITQIEKLDPSTEIDYTNAIEDIIDDAKDAMDGLMGNDHSDHDHGHDHDAP